MPLSPDIQLNLIALRTILRKELGRMLRIWTQALLPPVITMSLYFIIFGKFIGSQIKQIDGFTYIQYLVPGLILMSIMTNAYANTSSSFFLAKFTKSIDEMLVAPMSNLVILLGFILGGVLRGLIVGSIVLLISLLFTPIPLYHPFMMLFMAVLVAMVFALGGLINAIYAKSFDDISFIPTFILTPLTYLGGIFYSIKQLPPTWQALSHFNPILSMVDSFRYSLLGIADMNIWIGFSMVSLLFLLLFFYAWSLLTKGRGIKV
jgi:ABC-2 type transport system permease protein